MSKTTKMIIYKENGVFKATTEENYKAPIRNAFRIQLLNDFNSAQEIIEYYCKYSNAKPEDFTVIE